MNFSEFINAMCLRFERGFEEVHAALRAAGVSQPPETPAANMSTHTKTAICTTFHISAQELQTVISEHCEPGGVFAVTGAAHDCAEFGEYTVCFLFDKSLNHVLLVRKDNTKFAGLLNGCGGRLETGERPEVCAIRKIQEETGISRHNIQNFTWLGTLTLPRENNCKDDINCVLHYFTGIVDEHLPRSNGRELVTWHNTNYVQSMAITSAEHYFAGNGNLQLFVHMALLNHARFLNKNLERFGK